MQTGTLDYAAVAAVGGSPGPSPVTPEPVDPTAPVAPVAPVAPAPVDQPVATPAGASFCDYIEAVSGGSIFSYQETCLPLAVCVPGVPHDERNGTPRPCAPLHRGFENVPSLRFYMIRNSLWLDDGAFVSNRNNFFFSLVSRVHYAPRVHIHVFSPPVSSRATKTYLTSASG